MPSSFMDCGISTTTPCASLSRHTRVISYNAALGSTKSTMSTRQKKEKSEEKFMIHDIGSRN